MSLQDQINGYNSTLKELKKVYQNYTAKCKESINFFSEDAYFKPLISYMNHINWLLVIITGTILLLFSNINSFKVNDIFFEKVFFLICISSFIICLIIFFILKLYYFYFTHFSLKHVQLIHKCIRLFHEKIENFPEELNDPKEIDQELKKIKKTGIIFELLTEKANTSGKTLDKFRKFDNLTFILNYSGTIIMFLAFIILFIYLFKFILCF